MEAKLAAYRAKKEKQKQAEQSLFNRFKARLFRNNEAKTKNESSSNGKSEQENIPKDSSSTENDTPFQNSSLNQLYKTSDTVEFTKTEIITKWFLRICKFALWLSLWALFIELQFGAVFFTLSLILFTYMNTRTGPRDERLSAYSVFNKDCERIQGTLTAEQMQSNMFGLRGVSL
ncbi:saysvfn domain-containing protein 1-like protein [Plakobranchus ocellatus]|uniref:Saysvfn domain-containing protein 1-like protein n=1 Tax=Plakobranchus ocellatus TaxID=259542 RepID=A0AAV4CFI6_9GAST|nr:saysvfn domain-containing protein 1-like protein [Plakobranchus ocellatus]